MINHQKLNKLVQRLQNCESSEFDTLFTDFYLEIKAVWTRKGVIQSLAYKYRLWEDEVQSVADFKVFELIDGFDPERGNFYHLLSTSISRKLIDKAKERNEYANTHVEPFETSMEDDPNLIPFIPHANAEDEAIELLQKESEQRQLLTQLLERADIKCRQAVSALSHSKSYREVAKLLGISHHAAKRRVEKVSKHFDSGVHGNIYDYFTVPTQAVKVPQVTN